MPLLLTDDCDLRTAWLNGYFGGNGDIHLQIITEVDGVRSTSDIRISTSGGNAPTSVKIAAANLVRELEKHNLNEH